MNVMEAIEKRRALRGIQKCVITDDMISDLARAASLAPSCYNNQPWKFIFVKDEAKLEEMKDVLSKGNEWAYNASLIIAVISKKDHDCVIKSREYYQFDTGLGVGQMLLKAVEMGLVAHPIAGYSPKKARKMLDIPEEWDVVTLIPVSVVSDEPVDGDEKRPPRLPAENFFSIDSYSPQLDKKAN